MRFVPAFDVSISLIRTFAAQDPDGRDKTHQLLARRSTRTVVPVERNPHQRTPTTATQPPPVCWNWRGLRRQVLQLAATQAQTQLWTMRVAPA